MYLEKIKIIISKMKIMSFTKLENQRLATLKGLFADNFFLIGMFTTNAQKYNTHKPWAYWWWMGSAVDEAGIRKNLQDYAQAGFGGLHIIPIYGVKGNDANNLDFLSPKWNQMLAFTVKEANNLGLGIDMTMGTGWPFGGKQVSENEAAKYFEVFTENGKTSVKALPTKQKVKRAAPGGEGLVLDHFNKEALEHYMKPFQTLFQSPEYGVRALYNDSYEVYGANWTSNFLEEFQKRRGYDLTPYLNTLAKTETKDLLEKEFLVTIMPRLLTCAERPLLKLGQKALGKWAKFQETKLMVHPAICSTYMHFRMYQKLNTLEQNILTFQISEETPNLKKLDTVFQILW
jgi:hypothetical protein